MFQNVNTTLAETGFIMKPSKEYINEMLDIRHTHTHTLRSPKGIQQHNNCEQLWMLRHRDIREMKSRQRRTAKKLNAYRFFFGETLKKP